MTGASERRRGWFGHLGERDLDIRGRLAGRAGVTRSAVQERPTALAQVLGPTRLECRSALIEVVGYVARPT